MYICKYYIYIYMFAGMRKFPLTSDMDPGGGIKPILDFLWEYMNHSPAQFTNYSIFYLSKNKGNELSFYIPYTPFLSLNIIYKIY